MGWQHLQRWAGPQGPPATLLLPAIRSRLARDPAVSCPLRRWPGLRMVAAASAARLTRRARPWAGRSTCVGVRMAGHFVTSLLNSPPPVMAAIPAECRGRGWSDAKARAATQLLKNPNEYFYRHVAPHEAQVAACGCPGVSPAPAAVSHIPAPLRQLACADITSRPRAARTPRPKASGRRGSSACSSKRRAAAARAPSGACLPPGGRPRAARLALPCPALPCPGRAGPGAPLRWQRSP